MSEYKNLKHDVGDLVELRIPGMYVVYGTRIGIIISKHILKGHFDYRVKTNKDICWVKENWLRKLS